MDPAVVDALNRHRVEVVPPGAPLAPDHDQPRGLEHIQMLHDRGAAQMVDVRDHIAGGAAADRDEVDDGAPGRIGQRPPHRVVVVANRHVTHW